MFHCRRCMLIAISVRVALLTFYIYQWTGGMWIKHLSMSPYIKVILRRLRPYVTWQLEYWAYIYLCLWIIILTHTRRSFHLCGSGSRGLHASLGVIKHVCLTLECMCWSRNNRWFFAVGCQNLSWNLHVIPSEKVTSLTLQVLYNSYEFPRPPPTQSFHVVYLSGWALEW